MVEESPFAVSAGRQGQESRSAVQTRLGAGVPDPSSQESAEIAPGVRILGAGTFADRDQVHRGSGRAILGQTPGGASFLRFESFAVTNGPDLHVFLSRAVRPTSHDEVHDGIYVGKLKASEGAFNYELPSGADLAGTKSVVVYCVPFRVIFTSAPLAGP
jgi:hypothetical protein